MLADSAASNGECARGDSKSDNHFSSLLSAFLRPTYDLNFRIICLKYLKCLKCLKYLLVTIYFYSHVSVRNDDAGKPSVLKRSPVIKSLKAYLTATGSATEGENMVIPVPVIKALAG